MQEPFGLFIIPGGTFPPDPPAINTGGNPQTPYKKGPQTPSILGPSWPQGVTVTLPSGLPRYDLVPSCNGGCRGQSPLSLTAEKHLTFWPWGPNVKMLAHRGPSRAVRWGALRKAPLSKYLLGPQAPRVTGRP